MRSSLLYGLVVIALGGCGGGPVTPPGPPPPPPPPPPPVSSATVQVRNSQFDPEIVALTAGGTVTWNWVGQGHNLVPVLSPTFTGNSTIRDAPATHGPITFSTPGTYRYICTVHGTVSGGQTSGMKGTIIVQ